MLSDAAIRRAKPQDKTYKLSDSGGLFLLIQPNGSRLWRLKYRFGGKEKLLSFGSYPAVSLAGAREARDSAKDELRANRDPSLTRKQRRAAAACTKNHLQAVSESWGAAHGATWTPKHKSDVESSLERLVWPALGNVPVPEITAPMVLEVIQSIERKRAKETARRVRQRLSAIFVHAIASGLATYDPAEVIKGALAPLQKGRQPAIIEIGALRDMLRAAEDIPSHPVTVLAMRFLALTAVRPGEVHGMPWHELEGAIWRIPKERMKMRKPHAVPLSRQAIEILDVDRHGKLALAQFW